VLPLSIPSPPVDWQIPFSIPIGWLPWAGPGAVIEVHTYALCIMVGIVVAAWITEARLRRRGVAPWAVVDVGIWAVILGIVGARVWHVATHPTDFFFEGADLGKVFAIWDGGGAIFGSLLFGGLGVWLGCRITGIRFFTFTDAVIPGLLLAQVFGRLGNYVNHEIFGLPTSLPWGLEIEATNPAFPVGLPADTLFHPTFLYEMIWNFVGALAILALTRKGRFQWGKTFALYLIWYGLGRSWLEPIRLDPSEIVLGLRINEWGAILTIVIGLVIWVVQSYRHPGREASPYLPGREPEPDDDVERFSESDFDGSAQDADDESDDAGDEPGDEDAEDAAAEPEPEPAKA
jgi:prolipoprotein diacylglyceryl transferase